MTTERILDIVENSSYGLTVEELSSKMRINEKSTLLFLDKLIAEKKVKKTKAGSIFFYRKFVIFIPIVMIFLMGAASAQDMNSTSFKIIPVLDSAGTRAQSDTYVLFGSVGQISGTTTSVSFNLCSGFMCNFIELILHGKITFLLEFNISGNTNDTAFVDNYTQTARQYTASDLSNYYACLQDVNITGSPTFGIIYAGSTLNYINISSGNSFVLRLSQDIPGNKFILPITSGNCTVINTRTAEIAQYGTLLQPFVLANEAINAIELALSYPSVQIVGSFDKSGAFGLIFEKNETNENQIIVKPV
ncbi:MAG TPA: hypothetical protein HA230_00040 [Candidatus Aenigmarchaeota archaeon]|nr:hypothetical protein [Candidatus Aenigmarchaeota archaeon]